MDIANDGRAIAAALLMVASCSGDGPTTPSPDATTPLDPCAPFAPDPSFEALELDGAALSTIYGVWGLADDDIYVAIGGQSQPSPNETRMAIAHWNGSTWALDRLSNVVRIDAMSGRSGADLWLSAIVVPGHRAMLRNGGGSGWASTSMPHSFVYDMLLLPPDDGWMTASAPGQLEKGVTLRLNGDWTEAALPARSDSYSFRELSARDAQHVYGIGHVDGAMDGDLLGAFDGKSWKTVRAPSECGVALEDVVGVAPDAIYTIGTTYSSLRTRNVCRVSSDLGAWKPVGSVPYGGSPQGVAATAGGTVVPIWANLIAGTASVFAVVRGDVLKATCELSPGLGDFVAWSAPASPNVHVFSGLSGGNAGAPARHLVKRFDP